jgi:hypothetical protein
MGAPEAVQMPRDRERALRRLVWLLPLAFALHEAEEWNIVAWFQLHFTPRTGLTDAGARTLLAAFSAGAFAYVGLASLLPTRAMLHAVLGFFIVAGVGNALTHVFWWLQFGVYAPGVVSAALLVTPLTAWLSLRAVRDGLVSAWTVGGLFVLALVPLAGVARAGSQLTAGQLALHALGARLGAWLWGAP